MTFNRTRSAAWLTVLIMIVSAALSGLAGSTSSAQANPRHPRTTVTAAAKDHSKDCANLARKQAKKNKKYKYWVCRGSKAKYLKKKKVSPAVAADKQPNGTRPEGSTGPGADSKDPPTGPWTTFGTQATATKDGTVHALADDDDSRCELVPECTNIRTLYRADIKANALYGYSDEIWGAFDVIYFQSFNGASSRYRLKLIWDYGYPIDSNYWTAQVRKNLTGLPDPVTGSAYFHPDRISLAGWTQIRPSSTTFEHTTPTVHTGVHTGKHHDDLYGSFTANGQLFGTSTVHLPDFHCPNHGCKYYGPTGPA